MVLMAALMLKIVIAASIDTYVKSGFELSDYNPGARNRGCLKRLFVLFGCKERYALSLS